MDDEIEKTLNSLAGAKRAQPSESFEAEVLQRLSFAPTSGKWLPLLRYGVAAMIILGALNTFALFSITGETQAGDTLGDGVIEAFYDTSSYFFNTEE